MRLDTLTVLGPAELTRLFDKRDPSIPATLALAEAIRGNTQKARAYLDVSRALTRYASKGEA
jgi:hypothetical protein